MYEDMELLKISFTDLESYKSSFVLLLATSVIYLLIRKWNQYRTEKEEGLHRPHRLLIIVGCDSGLGLSMAHWAAQLNYQVIAGCVNPDGEGSKYLRATHKNLTVMKVDVTSDGSVETFREECEGLLKDNARKIKLWGIIFNAAIMTMGEFLWQTKDMAEKTLQVNFWGALRITKEFKKMMFQQKCRLIFTSSDCSRYSLPTLSTYCASKAALQAWAMSLRQELGKYGVTVTCHDPGSFIQQSQIFAQVPRQLQEMEAALPEEDLEFYGNFIADYRKDKNEFNSTIPKFIRPLDHKRLQGSFKFLLEGDIKTSIVYSSSIFDIMEFIRDFFPVRLGDKIINKLLYCSAVWTPREYGNEDVVAENSVLGLKIN